MKIYTKTGDDGTTGLFAGGRVPKDDPRIAAYGSVDELNAILGIVAHHAHAASGPQSQLQQPALQSPDVTAGPTVDPQQPRSAADALALLVEIVGRAQHDLFAIGAELATPNPAASGTQMLRASDVERLEQWIDRLEGDLDPLTNFIIPGGSLLAGWLHWARTVCRRCERDVVRLTRQPGVADCTTVLVYLNRLSDLLFVMARAANRATGFADVPWQKPS